MYTIQPGNPDNVVSMEEMDIESQSITIPAKTFQPPVNCHSTADISLQPTSFFGNILHKYRASSGTESSAGSDINTRSSSPSENPRSDASYSIPSPGPESSADSRSDSLASSRDNGDGKHGFVFPQRAAIAPVMATCRGADGHDFDFSSPEDRATSFFIPQMTQPRKIVVPKPYSGQNLPRPSSRNELSDDEVDQVLVPQAVQASTTGYKSSPTHFAAQDGLGPALEEWMDCVTTATPKPRPEHSPKNLKRGRRTIVLQKHLMQAAIISLNGLCIFSTWWWGSYYYILLPFITATVALNIVMIVSIIFNLIRRRIFPENQTMPEKPESLVLVIPCYNETKEEMLKSLNSLISQNNIDQHPRAVMIICDGKVRGPDMEKTTADYLFEDILVKKDYRIRIPAAYLAWDQQFMDIEVQKGTYQGMPYFCIIKQQNQGKRDSLIVIRSFLFNYNIRFERPETVFTSVFFAHMASFIHEAGIEHVDHLIGMDADTVFDDDCIAELLLQSRFDHVVGVCGYVAVDWKDGNFNPWRLYQSAEYTIAQGLRRLHQSVATHKVSCLPGCCQLLKICEETCGPEVLIEKFGYCPTLTDGMLTQIRATASEDRNHVCHMLSARPKVQTRQALKAKAYTDVPRSWSVFLSQRRRWTLGATSNDLLLVSAPGVQWFERILAAVNVFTWFLNLFIFASVASFIMAATTVPVGILMAFVSVMLIPVTYYFCIPLWLCNKWLDRIQFWLGCLMYMFCGPFLNISVLLYACWYMDSFGWGKTRKVVTESEESAKALTTTPTYALEETPSEPTALPQRQEALSVRS
ncbi:chitin synthase-domain-containing protein [Penicillium malachiteum]|uniref:chitin synthase-domain-containing protein n=1 Tax=Penicillium malachiteum TaxID=1324776 RepID=UPI002548C481|nr:chitin synthase-domain-containing protein [Penicillium malachiteum]KAJ5726595.1 chitin synthase-domain-containing protein [Penicillium malachiteum]